MQFVKIVNCNSVNNMLRYLWQEGRFIFLDYFRKGYSTMFDKIKAFIDEIKDLFAKIGETGFIQAILNALKDVLRIEKKDDAADIVDVIVDTVE